MTSSSGDGHGSLPNWVKQASPITGGFGLDPEVQRYLVDRLRYAHSRASAMGTPAFIDLANKASAEQLGRRLAEEAANKGRVWRAVKGKGIAVGRYSKSGLGALAGKLRGVKLPQTSKALKGVTPGIATLAKRNPLAAGAIGALGLLGISKVFGGR